MKKKIYTVTDLGGGDGGKGSVVHKICTTQNPHTVIKVGGAQGSHGVWTSKGEKFNFGQFGCGTFEGIKTFISKNFVVSPIGILNEVNILQYEKGISNPFSLIIADENALITTPFHGRASRIKELARKDNPRNIVGVGVGEAFIDSKIHPDLAFHLSDLKSDFIDKLKKVRDQKVSEIELFKKDFLPKDLESANLEIQHFYDDEYFNWIVDQFKSLAKQLNIVDQNYLKKNILSREGNVVMESSHGILTDYIHGFNPHTSRLRTLPEITSWSLLKENDYDGKVVKLGVTRAHQIKHGAGPFVTENELMANSLFKGKAELENPDRYRGKVRVGALDTVMLRYAINVAGGAEMFDGICLTWFDSMVKLKKWPICHSYNNFDLNYFSEKGDILVKDFINESDKIYHQSQLTKSLYECIPNIEEFYVDQKSSTEDFVNLCKTNLNEKLGVPIRMLGLGPTEDQKILI
ncbi:MAG: adenylosuccinate synthetase [Candidatus Nomurabacteria bacterium]